MRKLKTLSLILAIAGPAGAGPPAAAGEVWREQSEKTIDATNLAGIKIENPRGEVSVRRGAGGRLHLTALKIVRANDREQSARFARGTQVVTSTEDGKWIVKVRYPQRQSIHLSFWDMFSCFELPRVEVRLDVEVPEAFSVWANSTSGDLATEEIAGPQVLESTSGDISVRGARAPLKVSSTSGDVIAVDVGRASLETVSGDLEAERVRGLLRASTTSGEISVKAAQDSLQLGTVSGDIRVDAAPLGLSARTTSGEISAQSAGGVVRLESSSGDVRVTLAGPLRGADVSTVSGDIEASLLGALGCTLEMRTTNGTLDLDVPLSVKTVSRYLVTGVVRNGTPPVRLRSSSGDIHLTGAGD
jgi:hypothetical protein